MVNEQMSKPIVFSVTSGKGGVGKTNISVNLAYCLSRLGYKTLLLDADLGLGNVDVLLGLTPEWNISHFFAQGVAIEDIVFDTGLGFKILPASSGVDDLLSLTSGQKLALLEAMDPLDQQVDICLVDTGAGINDNVLYFNLAVQQRLVVLTPEPTSLTDAYGLIKVLHLRHGVHAFQVVVNMVKNEKEAKTIFKRLYLACDHFLQSVSLRWSGFIPLDPLVRQAVSRQIPLCHLNSGSPACRNMLDLAQSILAWDGEQLDGNIKFFWKRLLFQH